MRFHHAGIAVESLDRAIPIFSKLLGPPCGSPEVVEDQKVRVVAFELGGGRIELLEATAPDSPVAKFIARRGPGIHHLTLAVPNLAEFLKEIERSGIDLIDKEPRAGAGREHIAFLHPKSTAGVLIELVEE